MAQATMFRSNSALTNDQIRQYAPSVFAQEPHESRGERYAYIPTSDVLEGLRNEGFVPMVVGQTRTRNVGKREHTKHMLRFRHESLLNTTMTSNEIPEIVLVNSHDGTSSYQLMGGIFRIACANGIIAGDISEETRIRHSGRDITSSVIEGSYRVIDNIKAVAPKVELFKSLVLDPRQQEAFAKTAMELRWDEGESPVTASAILQPRRYADRGNDLWTTFNRAQESLIRGGVRGVSANGGRTTTRAVSSISENVRINKSLWALTERMAEILTA